MSRLRTTRGAPSGPSAAATGALDEIAGLLGGQGDHPRRLLHGVMAGAFVGAALAGALLRSRRSRGPDRRA